MSYIWHSYNPVINKYLQKQIEAARENAKQSEGNHKYLFPCIDDLESSRRYWQNKGRKPCPSTKE